MQTFYILPIDASLQAPGTFPINQDFALVLLAYDTVARAINTFNFSYVARDDHSKCAEFTFFYIIRP